VPNQVRYYDSWYLLVSHHNSNKSIITTFHALPPSCIITNHSPCIRVNPSIHYPSRVKGRWVWNIFPQRRVKKRGFKKPTAWGTYLPCYIHVCQDKRFIHPTLNIGWFSSNKLCFSFCQKCQESFGHKSVFFKV
jgi:hypothetical protein